MHVSGFGKMFSRADEQLDPIPTPENFTLVVLRLVERYGLSHFDAIMELCNHYEREYESVRPLLTSTLKSALLEELSSKRMLKDRTYLEQKLG